jgi:hypothetical protein
MSDSVSANCEGSVNNSALEHQYLRTGASNPEQNGKNDNRPVPVPHDEEAVDLGTK